MSRQRLSLGRRGEDLARDYLKRSGYKILTQNYRGSLGEIDIIAEDAGTLAFVEVKTRSSTSCGQPFEAITSSKKRQLSKVALEYLSRHDLHDRPARFDVVGVLIVKEHPPRIELLKNAFEVCSCS